MGEFQDECKVCGQNFRLEPGFYFGAAYVSYGINIGVMLLSIAMVYFFVDEPTFWTYVTPVFVITLLGFPITFRMSRLIWAYMFIPKSNRSRLRSN